MTDRPELPQEELTKPLSSGGTKEPLELLPEREWLNAQIKDVEYRIAMFNGQVQYLTDFETKEPILRDGEKIPRKEFNITFNLNDYALKNGDPRKAWLKLGSSFSDKGHLKPFLMSVVPNAISNIETPKDVVNCLIGTPVKLQLTNKQSKDGTRTYQNVVWDAVKVGAKEQDTADVQKALEEENWDSD